MVLKFVGGEATKVEHIDSETGEITVDVVKASEQQEQQASMVIEQTVDQTVLVDSYTKIQAMIDAAGLAPFLKEQEKIKKELAALAASNQFADKVVARLYGSEDNYVEFSAKSDTTAITDKPGLIHAMGQANWNQLATVTLENAKNVLSQNMLNDYTAKVPGSRRLKTVFYKKEGE